MLPRARRESQDLRDRCAQYGGRDQGRLTPAWRRVQLENSKEVLLSWLTRK